MNFSILLFSALSVDREYLQNSISTANSQQHLQHQQYQLQQLQQQQLSNTVASGSVSATASTGTSTTSSQSTTPESHASALRGVVIPISTAVTGVASAGGGVGLLTNSPLTKRPQVLAIDNMTATAVPLTTNTAAILPSHNKIILQEPDVIASTKLAQSKTTDSITLSGPIAPPRRKKKSRRISSSSSEQFNMNEGMRLPPGDMDDDDSDTRSVKSVKDVQKLRDDLAKEIENSWNETCSLPRGNMSVIAGGIPGNIYSTHSMSGAVGGIGIASSSNVSSSTSTIVAASAASLPHTSTCNTRPVTTAALGGSINRISHSLGNSSTSVYSKPSPSNSAKSNSAPGRVRYL